MKRTLIVAAVAAAVLAGPATAAYYTPEELAKINLFRQMDLETGALTTQISMVNSSPGGSSGGDIRYIIDGGGSQWQRDWYNQPLTPWNDPKDGPQNDHSVSLLIEMNASKAIGSITQYFDLYNGEVPRLYRILGSNDLEGGWSDLTGWREGNTENAGGRTITTAINGSYQYLQFEYIGIPVHSQNADAGTERDLFYLREIVATPMAGSQIETTSGYTLTPVIYTASLQPGADPLIAAHNGVSGNSSLGWKDPPGNVTNGNPLSFLRPSDHNDGWFVLSLNDLHRLAGFAVGTYNSAWNDILIQYTDEDIFAEDWDDSNWKFAYEQKTALTSTFGMRFFFDEETGESTTIDARYLRISTTKGNGTVCDFELYAVPIPEPMTMSLLALGGLALLRRRK